MEYTRKQDAEQAFCFTIVKRIKAQWRDGHTWCERCGYGIPFGEEIVVVYEIYEEHPVQIFHKECYK